MALFAELPETVESELLVRINSLRSRDGQVAGLPAHLDRLRRGAEVLGIPVPDIDLAAAVAGVLVRFALQQYLHSPLYGRLPATARDGGDDSGDGAEDRQA